MDELIKQGQWWWPFFVPIATGILAMLGSWLGSRWGKTTEHKQWLRNKKMEAYSDFLSVAESMVDDFTRWPEVSKPEHSIKHLSLKRSVLKVVGSPEARHHAMEIEVNAWIIFRFQQLFDEKETNGWPDLDREEFIEVCYKQVGTVQTDLIDLVTAVRKDLGAYTRDDADVDKANRDFAAKFLGYNSEKRILSPTEII
ncbi:hypothetical protein [Paenarthrobacter sp. YIM B13468]|uniref:hypothetical protein n=1 Tax=Paenarthrobacter sp. YIM B13468 TaxID=3366295 RepID=UPI00366B0F72